MERMLGVVNLDDELDYLNELTYFRCGASVPFAGRYRLIDFVISSMINSNIFEVAVFVRSKYRSLMDHLGEGKQWNLDKKRGGLFILPPDWHDPGDISQGGLRYFHNNMDFFTRGTADYVLHTGSQHICNLDFQKVVKQHKQKGSDITLIYKNVPRLKQEHQNCRRLEIDGQGQVRAINNEASNPNIYMEMFIINKELLIEIVGDCIAHHQENFFRDGIMNKLDQFQVDAYAYNGYHAVINSLESYYSNSMDLLNPKNQERLFMQNNRIYTKVKDETPTKYLDNSRVSNCLVANGCQIAGKAKNSVIFRDVNLGPETRVENSIIMAGCQINQGAFLKNIILDKEVTISQNQELVGSPEKPFAVAKRRNI